MAKGFLKGLWDKVSGEEQARQEAEAQERRRQEAERIAQEEQQTRQQKSDSRRLEDFKDEVYMYLYRIEKKIQAGYNDPSEDYQPVIELGKTAEAKGWLPEYYALLTNHRYKLSNLAISGLKENAGLPGLCDALSAMSCYQFIASGNLKAEAKQATDTLFQTILVASGTLCFLTYDSYGKCQFQFDNPLKMEEFSNNASEMIHKITEAEANLQKLSDTNICRIISQYLTPQFIQDSCQLMWFYAQKRPFDIHNFENARKIYISHTAYPFPEPKAKDQLLLFGPVEEVLARVYAKFRVGGIGTARQEKAYIDSWLAMQCEIENFDPCFELAHGLAWMEINEFEIEVLRRLINAGADVPAEMQDRLTFLEIDGTSDIKIYNTDPFEGIFFFDSSAIEWSKTEISVFFRKVAAKRKALGYALAMDKWTKNLPLVSGHKISYNKIVNDLERLVKDFDGEVDCSIVNAAAINLYNVVFPNAVLFSFTSIRNRCVSVLFSCEKIGRNLAVTIFTLFTPSDKLQLDEMERYCIAVKDNMYVESFRESILQVVDESIIEHHSIYDDGAPSTKIRLVE